MRGNKLHSQMDVVWKNLCIRGNALIGARGCFHPRLQFNKQNSVPSGVPVRMECI
jgi:hypothetical protein